MTHETTIEEMEWLNKKLGMFSGSKISDLFVSGKKKDQYFGDKAIKYIRSRQAELLTMEPKEQSDYKQTQWGRDNEPKAVAEFEKFIGIKGTYYGITNPEFFTYGEHAGVSPDWAAETFGAEIKCPYDSAVHLEYLAIATPEDFKDVKWEIYCQIQMQLFVMKWDKCFFVSYDPRMIEPKYKLKVLEIYPDEVWVAEFKARLQKAIVTLNAMMANLDYVISNKMSAV